MKTLIKQIKEKGFKPLKFAIFNYMDDAGYISEIEAIHKTKFSIEDFEYMAFELSLSEVNGFKYRVSSVLKKYEDLKHLIEVETVSENGEKSAMLFMLKEEGKAFIVKLVDFDLLKTIK